MVVLTTTWGLAGIRCARREDSVGKQGVELYGLDRDGRILNVG